MAHSTDKRKTGNVTVSTVRTPEEALQVARKLKAANIDSVVTDEREASFGGVKVLVPRSEAQRAIQHLQLHNDRAAPAAPEPPASYSGVSAPPRGTGWSRIGRAILTVLAIGGAAAALYF